MNLSPGKNMGFSFSLLHIHMHWHREIGETLTLDVANTGVEVYVNATIIYISITAKIQKQDLLKFTQCMKIHGLTFL